MAFMAHGSTPGRGPFGGEINLCVQHILNNSREGGFIISPGSASHGPMYGHGFATLFLAEVYGMHPGFDGPRQAGSGGQVDHQHAERGRGLALRTQTHDADISVTICQVMALRAARNAGIYVPNETIDRCIEYVKRSQNPDGGFMYQLSQPGESRFPRSAAGVVAFYNAGIYEGDELERGLDYLLRHMPRGDCIQPRRPLLLRPLLRRPGPVAGRRRPLAAMVRPAGSGPIRGSIRLCWPASAEVRWFLVRSRSRPTGSSGPSRTGPL
jgi:hypothetical protein